MELIYVANGHAKIKIPSESFALKEGDYIAINSNTLHYGAANPECRLQSLVFSPALVAGGEDFAFAKKYIHPLLSCNSFSGYAINASSSQPIAHCFHQAFDALMGNCFGFEFIVRENLSRICLFLYQEFGHQIDTPSAPLNQDHIRIQKMLSYIHKNFANAVSLSEISAVAGISERECLRCFQKTIQLSPIQYLLKYRVMQGAEMLLGNPAGSISETATSCGFDSPSNFAKIFKRFYHCTPKEYRNLKVGNR